MVEKRTKIPLKLVNFVQKVKIEFFSYGFYVLGTPYLSTNTMQTQHHSTQHTQDPTEKHNKRTTTHNKTKQNKPPYQSFTATTNSLATHQTPNQTPHYVYITPTSMESAPDTTMNN